jgi:hypothetical protein
MAWLAPTSFAPALYVCGVAGWVLQEKEKLYVELKGILARQPGPEVAEQLSIYQVSCAAACRVESPATASC